MPTLDAALLCSSRAGSDLGCETDRFKELCQLGFLIPKLSLMFLLGKRDSKKKVFSHWCKGS